MYLVSVQRKPKSVITKIKHFIIINFLKEDPLVIKSLEGKSKKNDLENEFYKIGKDENFVFLIHII